MLLGPNKSGYVSMRNFKQALLKNATDATKDSRVLDFVIWVLNLSKQLNDDHLTKHLLHKFIFHFVICFIRLVLYSTKN